MAYASTCAWVAVHPDRAAEGWARHGLTGDAIASEHAAWRAHFVKYPDERQEFEQQFESFKRHWAAQRS